MKRILFLLAFSIIIITSAFAKEPVNLAIAKQQVIHYHHSGEYSKEMNQVVRLAMQYLQYRIAHPNYHGKKPAIVLDIDETSLSNYAELAKTDFCGTMAQIQQAEDQGTNPAILPTLKLYRYAKEHHVAVFFITGRLEESRLITAKNLEQVGYKNWDGLILREGKHKKESAAIYKTAIRQQLVKQGYDILLNLGDQKSDLTGGYADKIFKLPNPYYLIP